jgi:hypothetical protein
VPGRVRAGGGHLPETGAGADGKDQPLVRHLEDVRADAGVAQEALLERAVVTALLRRPAGYLRELLAEPERLEQPDLARLARQVLAWPAGQRR